MINLQDLFRESLLKCFESIAGMKILLLDNETTAFLSVLITKGQLAEHEIYLTDYLDSVRESIPAVKCICFLRPSGSNIDLLCKEFQAPCYSEYHIYFSSFLKSGDLERLAQADSRYQVINGLCELFTDAIIPAPNLFSLGLYEITGEQIEAWSPKHLKRCAASLASLLLALRVHPQIRFDKSSPMVTALAHQVREIFQVERDLFDFRHQNAVLLIVDRRNDLLTPLLKPWTYEAMLDEAFGIKNGRILDKHHLTDPEDKFYNLNRWTSYGHLATLLNEQARIVKEHREKNLKQRASVAEMRRILAEYSDWKAAENHLSKHLDLQELLREIVENESWLQVGEIEQSIACGELTTIGTMKEAIAKLSKGKQRFGLIALYCVRYCASPGFRYDEIFNLLQQYGLADYDGVLKLLIRFAREKEVKSVKRKLPGFSKVYLFF